MASYFSQIYHVHELPYVLWVERMKGQRGVSSASLPGLSPYRRGRVFSLYREERLSNIQR